MLTLTGAQRSLFLSCLSSAFRTAIACTIVGGATLYGPLFLRNQVAFPAFSYVTVILIVTDAKLGDTFRGCWFAFCATVQAVCPAILSLWLIGPSRLTATVTSVAVALGAFVVVLPETTHLVSKRIALGQIVIVYVVAYINGVRTDVIMHPVHVAASTALGVLACVLALLFPYPSLACCQVKRKGKLFVENASERLKLFVNAFCAEDNTSSQTLFSQAKSLTSTGTKLLHTIKFKQESIQWERLPIKFLKPYGKNPIERLQDIQIPLKGMEIALSNSHSFPVKIIDKDLKNCLHNLEEHITLILNQVKTCMPFDLATVPESTLQNATITLQSVPKTPKDLPPFFFLFCMKLLQTKITATSSDNSSHKTSNEPRKKDDHHFFKWVWSSLAVNKSRFMPAFKSSLSLGFAVLFGLIYSKENGYWSGLPVAISFAASREAAFRVANVKAQGTVLGTVYGVLGCFVFERFVKIRFLFILPWFIFSSLLRRSCMYGQAGGISAEIGAVLILGRENFGPPSKFAIARIVETFIGLSCSIMVEILLQPTRASTLAKIQLSKSLKALHECICAVSLGGSKDSMGDSQRRLNATVNELRKFIEEAEVEPNFWLLPFHSACYNKLLKSLSNMVDFLLFGIHAIGLLEKESGKILEGNVWKLSLNKLDGELELFKERICPSIKCFEEVTLVKSLDKLEKELRKSNTNIDVELGKLPNPNMFNFTGSNIEDEMDKFVNSHLQRLREVGFGKVGEKEVNSHELVVSLSAFAFCMCGLMRETREIEREIKELLQWENPSSHVNLYEICCKIRA